MRSINTETGKVVFKGSLPDTGESWDQDSLAWSADATRPFVSNAYLVHVFETVGWTEVAFIHLESEEDIGVPLDLTLVPGTNTEAVATSGGRAFLWDYLTEIRCPRACRNRIDR